VRPIGEDIVSGEMLLPSRHVIRPIDLGVLLSGGVTSIEVYAKPKVAVFPTGTELVEPEAIPQTGLALMPKAGSLMEPIGPENGPIIESNSRMFEAQVTAAGGEAKRFAPIPDDYQKLKAAVLSAVDKFDMLLINAGSSAGTEDYTVQVLREIGEVIVHGVAMKPGKPVVLAIVKGKPVIGLPGYPVSAYLAFVHFVSPILARLTGRQAETASQTVDAVLAKRIVSSLKHREYLRVKVGRVNGKLVASPLARGAGAAMSLVRADGFCVIPQSSEGIDASETAKVEIYRPLSEIDRTIVSVGSHDLIVDILGDLLSEAGDCFLSGTHVGSLAGLMALQRGETHIAPCHLLDEKTGVYNVSYLHEIFPPESMALIMAVGRTQGLMVPKGNPRDIHDVSDIPGKRFVNRQRGAGTRLFLDYRLKKAGLGPGDIQGYDREVSTHMAVAAAVQSGSADTGMGVSSAAKALGLDFIPLGDEEYDFALFRSTLNLPMIQALLDVLKSEAFHKRLAELGGYTWKRCGEVVLV
jgi:putative molybdopterin biosynthesis protein